MRSVNLSNSLAARSFETAPSMMSASQLRAPIRPIHSKNHGVDTSQCPSALVKLATDGKCAATHAAHSENIARRFCCSSLFSLSPSTILAMQAAVRSQISDADMASDNLGNPSSSKIVVERMSMDSSLAIV